MNRELRFNTCSLEASHFRNTVVPDLAICIENDIRPHLSYGAALGLYELRDFFITIFSALLYWLEVLSLIKNINVASRMLPSMLEWNQASTNDVDYTLLFGNK